MDAIRAGRRLTSVLVDVVWGHEFGSPTGGSINDEEDSRDESEGHDGEGEDSSGGELFDERGNEDGSDLNQSPCVSGGSNRVTGRLTHCIAELRPVKIPILVNLEEPNRSLARVMNPPARRQRRPESRHHAAHH